MDQQGVAWATATSYGNTITYTPEDRAARAFDGDVETAWRAGAFGAAIGQMIRVELDDAITTDHVNLVQPINGARDRYITKVQLRFDGGAPVDAELDASSRTATGQTITFPPRHFRRLEIEVTGSNVGQPPARRQRQRGRVRRGPPGRRQDRHAGAGARGRADAVGSARGHGDARRPSTRSSC